jgi:hypothetical protein
MCNVMDVNTQEKFNEKFNDVETRAALTRAFDDPSCAQFVCSGCGATVMLSPRALGGHMMRMAAEGRYRDDGKTLAMLCSQCAPVEGQEEQEVLMSLPMSDWQTIISAAMTARQMAKFCGDKERYGALHQALGKIESRYVGKSISEPEGYPDHDYSSDPDKPCPCPSCVEKRQQSAQ